MKKPIRGHSHTPAIAKGTYAVGTATSFDLHYNTAAAMWQQGHVTVYPNGSTVRMKKDTYFELYGGIEPFPEVYPSPRRREAIEHTRRKLGL